MNQERKVSVLRNLLERVQRRAAAPRVAASPAGDGPAAPAGPLFSGAASSAQPAAAPVATPVTAPLAQPKTSGRPGSSTLPLDFDSRGVAASGRGAADASSARPTADHASASGVSADRGATSAAGGALSETGSPSAPEDEAPPSAPRLREVPEEEMPAEERDSDEEEPVLKTPPPESGRQHVTPGPTATITEPDEDISITVSMEESEVPPSVSEREAGGAAMPMSASARQEMPEVSGPQPRLALVSEPEIELHGMTPMSSVAEPAAPVKPRRQDVDLAVSVPSTAPVLPSAVPSGVRPTAQPPAAAQPPPAPPAPPFARTAPSLADTRPSAGAPPVESAASPPVRLMAQPLADASGKPLPPVEVWASTFSPAVLRGQVATFVGQNANFEPRTFGELVRASIALGDDKS